MKFKTLIILGLFVLASSFTFGAQARVDENDQILTWNAPAVEPQQHAADNVGELTFINGAGAITKLADGLAQSSRIEACGPNALSPDGRHLALYMGTEGGIVSSLYLITDGNEPVLVDDAFQPVSCMGGNGILSFSPDSSRLVYIRYERNFAVEFADGILQVIDPNDFSELFSSRNTVAFEQNADGVAFVNFFTNDRGEADEAALTWWNGDVDRELTAHLAEENCKYVSAHVSIAPDGMIWLSLAGRCPGESTMMRVYRVNPADRSEEMLFEVESGGLFSTTSQTNSLHFSPDGNTVLYTVPDGITTSTASLHAYDVATGNSTVLVRQSAVVPSMQLPANAPLTISPDGAWMAVAVTSVNQADNSLRVYNVNDPSQVVEFEAGGSGDVISWMQFTPDSRRLVFVAGGPGGKDNSLQFLDLGTDRPLRIRRGTYSRWATLSPNGAEVAIAEYQIQEEGVRGPDYLNLVVVGVDSSETTTLFTGGEVVDDEVTNVQFAVPLHWFRR